MKKNLYSTQRDFFLILFNKKTEKKNQENIIY
jgi:hypothetical protein